MITSSNPYFAQETETQGFANEIGILDDKDNLTLLIGMEMEILEFHSSF